MKVRRPWCLKGEGRAHVWQIEPPSGGKTFVWGTCSKCKKRRAFRTAWPTRYVHETEARARVHFERRERDRVKREAR